jgi:hypothetical protein
MKNSFNLNTTDAFKVLWPRLPYKGMDKDDCLRFPLYDYGPGIEMIVVKNLYKQIKRSTLFLLKWFI